MEEIKVSIVCNAYNHEKYIAKCLDGFLSQKTDFKFEVLVHDDASTDNTADIIREYEKKYPDIIKPVYQTVNQYSKKVKIPTNFQYPRAKGEYIALCEGDDFWTDENKLQKQVDALEENKNCTLCVCRVKVANENGRDTPFYLPTKSLIDKNGVIPSEEFIKSILNGFYFQTSCYVFRKDDIMDFVYNPPEFYKKSKSVGDLFYMLYLGTHGDVYYFDEVLGRYRKGSVGGWNSRNVGERRQAINLEMMEALLEFDKYSNNKFHEDVMHEYDIFLFDYWFEELLKTEKMRELNSHLGKDAKAIIKRSTFSKKLVVFSAKIFPKFTKKLFYYLRNKKRK